MGKISAVYKIVNTVTGDFYVGSSKNVNERWMQHKWPSAWKQHPNSSMYLDMQKYGLKNFRFQILAPVMEEHLKQVEQEFIETLHPTYNNYTAKGIDVERLKGTHRKSQKKYWSQLCSYNGEELTLRALVLRFKRRGIEHPNIEAKKYLIKEEGK